MEKNTNTNTESATSHKDIKRIMDHFKISNDLMRAYTETFINDMLSVSDSTKKAGIFIDKYFDTLNQYLLLMKDMRIDFGYVKPYVSQNAGRINRVINLFDSTNSYGLNYIQKLIKLLVPEKQVDASARYLDLAKKDKIDFWKYSCADLFCIGITNMLLSASLNTCEFSIFKIFTDLYFQQENEEKLQDLDANYFIFISVYFYFIYQTKGISRAYITFYNKISKKPNYHSLLKGSLKLNPDNNVDSFDCVLLLKHILDIFKTSYEEPRWDKNSWCIVPAGYTGNGYSPINITDIYNWWITYLFFTNVTNLSSLEDYFKVLIDEEDQNGLLFAYSYYWINHENENLDFACFNGYTDYFKQIDKNADINKTNMQEKIKALNNLCLNKVLDGSETYHDKTVYSNSQEEQKSAATQIKEYISEHLTNLPFYSDAEDESQFSACAETYNIDFSHDGDEVYMIFPIETMLDCLFREDSSINIFTRVLNEHFKENFRERTTIKRCNWYSENVVKAIDKLQPDRKYAHRILNSKKIDPSTYVKLLSIYDVPYGVTLIDDTYLKSDAIKFFVKCDDVTEDRPLSKDEIKEMIENKAVIRFKANEDGKYKFTYNHVTTLLTEEQLIEVLVGKVYRCTITFTYTITYNKEHILVLLNEPSQGTNDEGENPT